MKPLTRFLTCLTIGSLVGCGVPSDQTGGGAVSSPRVATPAALEEEPGEALYEYVGLDRGGAPIVTGTLAITFSEGAGATAISGTWDLDGPADPNLGPQIGHGTLAGILDAGSISIDLNPGWSDNNVYLYGRFDNASRHEFRGTWNHSTLVGPVNEGRFSARRTR